EDLVGLPSEHDRPAREAGLRRLLGRAARRPWPRVDRGSLRSPRARGVQSLRPGTPMGIPNGRRLSLPEPGRDLAPAPPSCAAGTARPGLSRRGSGSDRVAPALLLFVPETAYFVSSTLVPAPAEPPMPADPQPPTPQPSAPQHAHRHVLALAGFCAVLALLCSVAFAVQGPSGGAAYYAYFALSLAPL